MNEPEDRLAKFEADIEKLGYSFDAQLAITTGAALDGRLVMAKSVTLLSESS